MAVVAICLIAPATWGQAGGPRKPPQETIAVMDLQAVGATPAEAQALTDRLREVLFESGRFVLVDRSQMDAVLNEQALQQTGCTSQECAVQVGRVLGVRKLVTGKVVKIGADIWLLSATLVDVETAQTLKATSVRHKGDYFALMDQRVAEIAAQLTRAGSTPAGAATTASGGAPGASGKQRVSIYPPSVNVTCASPICATWPDLVLTGLQDYLATHSSWAPNGSYKANGAVPGIDSASVLGDVEAHTWKGIFSVEPDVDSIVGSAKKLNSDVVLLYKAAGSLNGGGGFTAYLVDVPTGKVRQLDGNWLGSFAGYVEEAQRALKKLLEGRLKTP